MDGSPRDRRKPPPPEPPGKAGRGLSLPGPLPGPVLVSEGTGRKRSATARDETGPPGIRTERPAQSQARRKVMSPARGAVCGPPCRLSPGLRGRPREAPSPQDGGPLSSLSRGLTVCVDALGPPGLRASGPPASGPPGLRASGPPGLRASGPQGLRASGPPGLRVVEAGLSRACGPPGLRLHETDSFRAALSAASGSASPATARGVTLPCRTRQGSRWWVTLQCGTRQDSVPYVSR